MAFGDWLTKYAVSSQEEHLQGHKSYRNFGLLIWQCGQKQLYLGPKNVFHHSLLKPFLTPQAFLCSFSSVPIAYFLYPRKLFSYCLFAPLFPILDCELLEEKMCAFIFVSTVLAQFLVYGECRYNTS